MGLIREDPGEYVKSEGRRGGNTPAGRIGGVVRGIWGMSWGRDGGCEGRQNNMLVVRSPFAGTLGSEG